MLGEWWLANPTDGVSDYQVPGHRVPGDFVDDKISSPRLTTIGSLSEPGDKDIFMTLIGQKTHNAIWGINESAEYLSLFNAMRVGVSYQTNSPGGGTEIWQIGWYASGHVWVPPDALVDRVRIQFDVLDDWSSKSVVVGHDFEMGDGTIGLPIAESYEAVMDEVTVTLDFGGYAEASPTGYHAHRFSAFNVTDELQLDQIVTKWIGPLKTLLELLTCQPVRLTNVTAAFPGGSHFVTLHPNILQSTDERDGSKGQLHMLAPLGTLQEAGLEFSALLRNYFGLEATKKSRKHLLAMHQLAHSQSRLLDKSADAELLAAFRAIELYHSAAIGGTDLPKPEHHDRVDAIVAGAPGEWQPWAEKHLRDKNQKPLVGQLEEVVKRADKTGSKLVEAWPDFCKEAVECRNEIAHGTIADDPKTGLRYHAMSIGLRWILRHVYLRKLGVPKAKTNLIVTASNEFNQEMSMLKSWHGDLP